MLLKYGGWWRNIVDLTFDFSLFSTLLHCTIIDFFELLGIWCSSILKRFVLCNNGKYLLYMASMDLVAIDVNSFVFYLYLFKSLWIYCIGFLYLWWLLTNITSRNMCLIDYKNDPQKRPTWWFRSPMGLLQVNSLIYMILVYTNETTTIVFELYIIHDTILNLSIFMWMVGISDFI